MWPTRRMLLPGCNLVAIDIARYWNAVSVETSVGKRHRFRMANIAADFDRLLRFDLILPGVRRIALEPTGDYRHRPIAHLLLVEGIPRSSASIRWRSTVPRGDVHSGAVTNQDAAVPADAPSRRGPALRRSHAGREPRPAGTG